MHVYDDRGVQLLYELARRHPYASKPSHVIPEKQFVPDQILKHQTPFVPMYQSVRHEFKLTPITELVPPPGYDPGSSDFQSVAMTTSAKAA